MNVRDLPSGRIVYRPSTRLIELDAQKMQDSPALYIAMSEIFQSPDIRYPSIMLRMQHPSLDQIEMLRLLALKLSPESRAYDFNLVELFVNCLMSSTNPENSDIIRITGKPKSETGKTPEQIIRFLENGAVLHMDSSLKHNFDYYPQDKASINGNELQERRIMSFGTLYRTDVLTALPTLVVAMYGDFSQERIQEESELLLKNPNESEFLYSLICILSNTANVINRGKMNPIASEVELCHIDIACRRPISL